MSRPHGLRGEGSQQSAERYADCLDLDEEMFRATDKSLSAWINLPDIERRQSRLLHDEASWSSPAHDRLVTDRFATEARKTKLHQLGCLER